ncbi:MAG TPA: SCO family protein [Thermoanaerobaculia bacterium]|jgi:protein SCO1/2|nr:SCO family protein [Thermoanaerobaculia bacterium]
MLLVAGCWFVVLHRLRLSRRVTTNQQPATSNSSRAVLLTFAILVACQPKPELPQLFPVPNAQLVDETGRALQLDSMKGSVTVYNFIFTSCTGICPIMTNNMRAVTTKIDKDAPVRFVSISVDPARDTPAVLAEYAKRNRNDPRWTFVTGERDAIVNLSIKGFKLAAGDPMPGGEALLHSGKFAVADKQGMIRGYYEATDGTVADEVERAVEALLDE